MEDNIIKSIYPYICPHCSNDFFIELQTIPTVVSGILTQKDIESAKDSVLEHITSMRIEDDEKEAARKWVGMDETVFGPSDVTAIVETLKKQYERKN